MLKTVFLILLHVSLLLAQDEKRATRSSITTTASTLESSDHTTTVNDKTTKENTIDDDSDDETTTSDPRSKLAKRPKHTKKPRRPQPPTIKVPLGYHSFLVAFMKKKNFDPSWEDRASPKMPKDFTTAGPFICSGTILSPRWVVTTANPLAFYPVDSYVMISNHYFSNNPDNVTGIDMDFAMVFPYYDWKKPSSDVALIRTANHIRFDFETRNVDVFNAELLTDFRYRTDCMVVIWTYNDTTDTFWRTELRQTESKDYKCKHFNETSASLRYYCLDFSHLNKSIVSNLPCAINRGAPMVCNIVLMGAYFGEIFNGPHCKEGVKHTTVHIAIKLDQYLVKSWIENVISAWFQIYTNPLLKTLRSNEENVALKMCPAS